MEASFTTEFPIHFYHADTRGQLKTDALLDFFQATAGYHYDAQAATYEELKDRQEFWVLSRLSLEIACYPRWMETVKIRTWAREPQTIFALREYQAYLGEEVFACCTSAWVILKGENKRPQRPQQYMSNFPPPPDLPVLKQQPVALTVPDLQPSYHRAFCPTYDDLDQNGHVNNVKALAWLFRSHEAEFRESHQLFSLDVSYTAEMFLGDEILIDRWDLQEGQEGDRRTFFYRLCHANSGREALTARMVYKKR